MINAARLSLTDAIGAAVALLIGAGGYLLLIQKPLQEAGRLNLVRQAAEHAASDLAALQVETDRLRRDVDADMKKLAAIGGGLPETREIDRCLARVTATAAANGIAIDALSPMPVTDHDDHRETHVNFTGRGTFAGFHRMLRAVERDLEYADVTHFSVMSGGEETESLCKLTWSLRIYTTRSDPRDKGASRAPSQ